MQNFSLLAQKLSDLCSILYWGTLAAAAASSSSCDQPTCRAVRFAPANKGPLKIMSSFLEGQ